MKYSLSKLDDGGIEVRIADIAGQEQQVLEAIRQCRQSSSWACPSGECRSIGDMDERMDNGSIVLTLSPRPDTRINLKGLEECMGYMLHQAIPNTGG